LFSPQNWISLPYAAKDPRNSNCYAGNCNSQASRDPWKSLRQKEIRIFGTKRVLLLGARSKAVVVHKDLHDGRFLGIYQVRPTAAEAAAAAMLSKLPSSLTRAWLIMSPDRIYKC